MRCVKKTKVINFKTGDKFIVARNCKISSLDAPMGLLITFTKRCATTTGFKFSYVDSNMKRDTNGDIDIEFDGAEPRLRYLYKNEVKLCINR